MKYIITLLILLIPSIVLAHGKSALYLLTSSDVKALSGGYQYALTHGQNHQAVEWVNPETGLSGTMIPTKTYQTTYGQMCREYMASVQLDGSIQQAVGMACMQKGGSWQVTGEKQIKRHNSQIKFIYVNQQGNGNYQQTFAHPPIDKSKVDCSTHSKGKFHSDSFHEKIRTYQKYHQTDPEKREIDHRKPAKLIKLVAY